MSTISRRGFLGLVAGALAACKLIAPREHQLDEQVVGKAAPRPQSKQEAMDAYLRATCDDRKVLRYHSKRYLTGGTPIKAEHLIDDDLTPAGREYAERINRELNAQTHDERFAQYQRIKARKMAEWGDAVRQRFDEELWSA